jgi:DNA-binding SARP family transcriptional activator
MRDNHPLHLDLSHGPVAFTGPGAGDVVRALIATTLGGVTGTTPPGQVIMSTAEADEILGPDRNSRTQPKGAVITTDLTASLAAARTARGPYTNNSHDGNPTGAQAVASPNGGGAILLIINATRPPTLRNIRATLAQLNAAGIGVLVLGEHPEGSVCCLDADHIVTSVYGPAVSHLDGAHLFNLAIDHIGDACSPFSSTPSPAAGDHAQGVGIPTGTDTTDADHDAGDQENTSVGDGGSDAPHGLRHAEGGYDPIGLGDTEQDGPEYGEIGQSETAHRREAATVSRTGWHDGLIREIGTRDGTPLAYDLGAFTGLGLSGPGARTVLRSLWIQLIAPTSSDLARGAAEVIIPIETADALLGEPELEAPTNTGQPNPGTDATDAVGPDDTEPSTPATGEMLLLGWPGEVEDLDSALDQLEVAIATRTRERLEATTDPLSDSTEPEPLKSPIVLITLSPDDVERPDAAEDAPAALTVAEVLDPTRDALTTPDTPEPSAHGADHYPEDRMTRLREVSERGGWLGIAVIVLGHCAGGTNCHIDAGGHVSGPKGPGGFVLRDATLTQLDTASARAFFDNDHNPNRAITPDPTHEAANSHTALADTDDHPTDELVSHAQTGPTTTAAGVDKKSEEPHPEARMLPVTEPIPSLAPPPPVASDLERVPADALLVVLALGPLAVFARSAPGQPLREITGRLSPTQRLILAALAASTEPIHTEVLLDMCFPHTGGSGPVHRLHSHLTRLRTVLRTATGNDPATRLIAHTAERYHFSDTCWIDNHTLHAQLRTNTTVTDPEQAATRAAAAFALYRGPLLAGLEYDTDTHWLDPQREHTLRTMIDLARQLADHHAPTNPGQAATYLAAALHLDPYNDDTARHLITHHLAHGHHHAAQATLAQLARALAEIGETPRPETVALLHTPPAEHHS